MSSPRRTASFDLSLEALRRARPAAYRRWVLIGVLVSTIGYAASSASLTVQRSWSAALANGDPLVVLADLIALGLWLRSPRIAACVVVAASFADVHFSLLVLRMPTLGNIGLVVPAFVLAAGLLFGGRVALIAAAVLAISVPSTLWIAGLHTPGTGLADPSVVHFLVVLEVVLLATSAMLAALLRTFAEILAQHEQSEARGRELQAQLLHAQKLEALGLLAGGVAHDFNNLLTAVGGYGSLLGRSSDPRAREIGAEVVAAQRHGATLTRQLLAFARKDVAQPRPMDLAATLSGVTALLQRAVGERVQLHVEAAPGCVVQADPGRIEQVVLNLTVNARDALPEGGRVWLRCGASDGEAWLEVEDEGVGMDAATQARAFEPFFTTKDRQGGTGLGLATVHGIVTGSGGRIELDSRVGRGTRFRLRWPRAPVGPEPEGGATIDIAGADRRILLIEDNAGARAYVERLLLERGFRVTAARSAEEALSLVADAIAPPDLVLCDVILPGVSGPQLVARLRARWPALRCLFLSGYLGDVALGDGFDPAVDLVLKPFTPAELLARMASRLPWSEPVPRDAIERARFPHDRGPSQPPG